MQVYLERHQYPRLNSVSWISAILDTDWEIRLTRASRARRARKENVVDKVSIFLAGLARRNFSFQEGPLLFGNAVPCFFRQSFTSTRSLMSSAIILMFKLLRAS